MCSLRLEISLIEHDGERLLSVVPIALKEALVSEH